LAGYPQLRNGAILEIPTYLDRVALWGSFSKSCDEKKNVVAKCGLRRVLEKGEKKGIIQNLILPSFQWVFHGKLCSTDFLLWETDSWFLPFVRGG